MGDFASAILEQAMVFRELRYLLPDKVFTSLPKSFFHGLFC